MNTLSRYLRVQYFEIKMGNANLKPRCGKIQEAALKGKNGENIYFCNVFY